MTGFYLIRIETFPTVAASRQRNHAYAYFAAAFFSISLNISLVVTTFFHAIRRHYSPSCCWGEKTDSSECENMPDRIPQSLPTFYFSFHSEKNVWFKTGTTSHCQKDGWEVSPLRRRRVRSLNIEKKISSLNRKLNLESRLGIKIYKKEAIGLNSDNWKLWAADAFESINKLINLAESFMKMWRKVEKN